MAKMYYSLEEAVQKLGCNEEQLKAMVRNGKLREFRDAGKLNYKVDEVDLIVAQQSALGGSSAAGSSAGGSASGELSLEDSGEISLLPDETPWQASRSPRRPPSRAAAAAMRRWIWAAARAS